MRNWAQKGKEISIRLSTRFSWCLLFILCVEGSAPSGLSEGCGCSSRGEAGPRRPPSVRVPAVKNTACCRNPLSSGAFPDGAFHDVGLGDTRPTLAGRFNLCPVKSAGSAARPPSPQPSPTFPRRGRCRSSAQHWVQSTLLCPSAPVSSSVRWCDL